ncbi:hypothetical protein HDU86_003077 [Geranomyces michiganensis]|nr:hypothetical protein HDU86_003077 [Geranomyces michiganensis]
MDKGTASTSSVDAADGVRAAALNAIAIGTLRFLPPEVAEFLQLSGPAHQWLPWPTHLRPTPLPASAKQQKDVPLVRKLQFAADCGTALLQYYARPMQSVLVRVWLIPEDGGGRRITQALPKGVQTALRRVTAELLERVNCNQHAWNSCVAGADNVAHVEIFPRPSDKVQISDIYATMPSPAPFALKANATSKLLLDQCISRPAPRGMRSSLFSYQKRTLWKLLQREIAPQFVVDPDVMELPAADDAGKPYWLRISTGEVLQDPVFYEESRGGIICEEMGVGKTCICIALVLSTQRQLSVPPVDCIGGRVRVEWDPKGLQFLRELGSADVDPREGRCVGSLREMAAKQAIKHSVSIKHAGDRLPEHLKKLLLRSAPYYLKSEGETQRFSRHQVDNGSATRIYLSSATLVIVPDTLVNQWEHEINKHVLDRVLEVLVLAKPPDVIPPPRKLRNYDIVLISHPRFGRELVRPPTLIGDDYYFDAGLYSSPLLALRWLRVIVDEGHIMARKDAPQVMLAARLECERRWVCTGTPMPNILRKERGGEEVKDVNKLGGLLTEFLKVEPYASGKDVYKNIIAQPFLKRHHRGFEKLRDLMHRIMVRNRNEDIERDVRLPPLSEKIVRFSFRPLQRTTYNCIVAFIGANAVLSQREHRDYFFHPRQAAALRDVIGNLQEACFWLSPKDFIKDVYGTLENVREGLIRAGDRGYSPEDVKHLQSIWHVLTDALEDELWCAVMPSADLAFEVRGAAAAVGGPLSAASIGKNSSLASVAPAHTALIMGDKLERYLDSLKAKRRAALERGIVVDEDSDLELTATSSVKLTYLANEILKHSKTEKIIIYCQFEREIYYCHQMCKFAKVRCILFHKQMRVSERSQSVTTFNTGERASVMIMDVRLGAWGIDLSSASRVYFLSPVWQNDMERQAVKRAHRIGATRPVYVETLVIRGTLEEAIVSRRGELQQEISSSSSSVNAVTSAEADAPVKSFLEDRKLRDALSAAAWVEASVKEEEDAPDSWRRSFARLEQGLKLANSRRASDGMPEEDEEEHEDYYAKTESVEPTTGYRASKKPPVPADEEEAREDCYVKIEPLRPTAERHACQEILVLDDGEANEDFHVKSELVRPVTAQSNIAPLAERAYISAESPGTPDDGWRTLRMRLEAKQLVDQERNGKDHGWRPLSMRLGAKRPVDEERNDKGAILDSSPRSSKSQPPPLVPASTEVPPKRVRFA